MRKNQKYSKAYVYGLIEKWQESGLPYTRYCREEGINRGTFKHWLIKYRKEKGIPEPGSATFIPVELSTTELQNPSITGHSLIEINYPNGLQVKCPVSIAPDQLKALILL